MGLRYRSHRLIAPLPEEGSVENQRLGSARNRASFVFGIRKRQQPLAGTENRSLQRRVAQVLDSVFLLARARARGGRGYGNNR